MFSRKLNLFLCLISAFSYRSLCENNDISSGRSYFNQNINVSGCFFSRSSLFNGYGGVIYVSGSNYLLDIVSSMFYKCKVSSDNWCGAIFFDSKESRLKMVCAHDCNAQYNNFARIDALNTNIVEYLSIAACAISGGGYQSFRLNCGDQFVTNSNSSLNSALRYTGLFIVDPNSFICKYSTFSNNKATEYTCIYLSGKSGTITSSNIVHNDSPTGSAIVRSLGNHYITFSIFYGNSHRLFIIESGTLSVSSCFISHSSTLTIGTFVSYTNNTNTYTNAYKIPFFNSYFCHAEIKINGDISTSASKPKILISYMFPVFMYF